MPKLLKKIFLKLGETYQLDLKKVTWPGAASYCCVTVTRLKHLKAHMFNIWEICGNLKWFGHLRRAPHLLRDGMVREKQEYINSW